MVYGAHKLVPISPPRPQAHQYTLLLHISAELYNRLQGVLVRGHAGLVINKLSLIAGYRAILARRGSGSDWGGDPGRGARRDGTEDVRV